MPLVLASFLGELLGLCLLSVVEEFDDFFGEWCCCGTAVVSVFDEYADGDFWFLVHDACDEPGVVAELVGYVFFCFVLFVDGE